MTIRRSLALLLAAGLAITAAACSDDDPDENAATTTTEATTTLPVTTTTISDEDFAGMVESAEAALAAANGDFCKVLDAANSLPSPTNPAQVERTLPVYSATYDAFAASIEGEDPAGAEALRTNVATVLSEMEKADYDPEALGRLLQEQSAQSPEFTAAVQSLQEKVTAECTPAMAPPVEGGESPDTGE